MTQPVHLRTLVRLLRRAGLSVKCGKEHSHCDPKKYSQVNILYSAIIDINPAPMVGFGKTQTEEWYEAVEFIFNQITRILEAHAVRYEVNQTTQIILRGNYTHS